jgi:hypothetical protein
MRFPPEFLFLIVGSSVALAPGAVKQPQIEHDPEKWTPVFRKDHAQSKI